MLGGVLYYFRPVMRPLFAGGAHWVYSILWGLLLVAIATSLGRRLTKSEPGKLRAQAVNLLWHIPVWFAYTAGQPRRGAALASTALPATVFAFALTLVAAGTQNLAGAVLAHAFGDWLGSVGRYAAKTAA